MTNESFASRDDSPDRPAGVRRSTRGRRRTTTSTHVDAERDDEPTPELDERDERPRSGSRSRGGRRRSGETDDTSPSRTLGGDAGNGAVSEQTMAAILKQLETQNEQLRKLVDLQRDLLRRSTNGNGNGHAEVTAPAPRVGIFVDAANIELAAERARKRIDWGKAMEILTGGRRLVRAMAYSPIHDDPGVSMETQRFVEPFLDRGFKIVTKPLKRFADGTIKANVDIELALDLMAMCDRLDVVCLVSGDGDFQHLVETVQERGVRVEVVGIGTSVAANLRKAADAYVDLEPALISGARGRGN